MKIQYVAGFAVNLHKNEVALIEKLKPSFQYKKLNAIGGKIEMSDNSPKHAMVREFLEETGVDTNPDQWEHKLTLSGSDFLVHFFVSEMILDNLKSMEAEKVSIYSIDYLPDTVLPNIKWLLPLCLDINIITPINILYKD